MLDLRKSKSYKQHRVVHERQLTRQAIHNFKKEMRRRKKKGEYDVNEVKNRIELLSYTRQEDSKEQDERLITTMVEEKVQEQMEMAGRNLTYIYSQFIVRFRLISDMIEGTKNNWVRY